MLQSMWPLSMIVVVVSVATILWNVQKGCWGNPGRQMYVADCYATICGMRGGGVGLYHFVLLGQHAVAE